MMKQTAWVALLAMVLVGCATRSTVETRRQERAAAYAALEPAERALVDQGQIKVGLPEDAVYIAWGRPSQVRTSESADGPRTTWIYTGTRWQEHARWVYYPGFHTYPYGPYSYSYSLPKLDYEYVPYHYTAAEVEFQNGRVTNWQHITPPPR